MVEHTSSELLWRVLTDAYARLGFDQIDDEVCAWLVAARMIEPTSKLDTLRVLGELGLPVPHLNTLYNCLRRCVERDYRSRVATACWAGPAGARPGCSNCSMSSWTPWTRCWAALSSTASSASSWAEPTCSKIRRRPLRFSTIWTAVAPEAVLTFRTNGLTPALYPAPPISAPKPAPKPVLTSNSIPAIRSSCGTQVRPRGERHRI